MQMDLLQYFVKQIKCKKTRFIKGKKEILFPEKKKRMRSHDLFLSFFPLSIYLLSLSSLPVLSLPPRVISLSLSAAKRPNVYLHYQRPFSRHVLPTQAQSRLKCPYLEYRSSNHRRRRTAKCVRHHRHKVSCLHPLPF